MRRIHVVGTSGSGKTTLARQIAERLDIPYVELDALHWEPDWTPADKAILRARVTDALAGGAWVVDGNYTALHDLTLARADTLIWLDYPLPVVLWRVTTRTARRYFARTTLWNGNRERLGSVFSKDSIILWALTTWAKNRRRYRELSAGATYVQVHIVRLRSPRQTRRWLGSLAAQQPLRVHSTSASSDTSR